MFQIDNKEGTGFLRYAHTDVKYVRMYIAQLLVAKSMCMIYTCATIYGYRYLGDKLLLLLQLLLILLQNHVQNVFNLKSTYNC